MTTSNWIGGSGNWDTASDWNPLGPPTASSTASFGGTGSEIVDVEAPFAAASLILDDPNALIGIGAVVGAKLTVAGTIAIENGILGVGNIAPEGIEAPHIRIAAVKGSKEPVHGGLWFPGNAVIGATVENNSAGGILADGPDSLVVFDKTVTGHGGASIAEGATLEFKAAISSNVNFGPSYNGLGQPVSGGGTLELFQPGHFTGNIYAFEAGDTVALKGSWAFESLNASGGVTDVTFKASGGKDAALHFAGTYSENEFAIAAGMHNTTTIKFV